MRPDTAPERPFGRSGAFSSPWRLALPRPLMLVAVVLLTGGCDAFGGGETILLDSTEVSIDGAVHEVRIAGAGATDSIVPARIQAEPGDAIRFITADRRPHALTFTVDSLSPPIREFLERTGQLRGPPLVNEGASWIVLLADAPPGRYPFHDRSHQAAGVLTVTGSD